MAGRGRHPGSDRGQTSTDFAIGIGIFLLATAFTFTFIPSIITPFDAGIGGAENAQADRIADELVATYETDVPNEIDWGALEGNLSDEDDRVDQLGLRHSDGVAFDRVSIELTEIDAALGSGEFVGPVYDDDSKSAASSARIVTTDGGEGPGNCDPACRLIVRVW